MMLVDLKKRISVSGCAIPIIIALVSMSHIQFVGLMLLSLTIIVYTIGCIELTRLFGDIDTYLMATCFAVGGAVIATFFFSADWLPYGFPAIAILCGMLLVFLSRFGQRVDDVIWSISVGVFCIVYLAVPLGMLLKILNINPPCGGAATGKVWIYYLLITTKATDIGAYFGGRCFKWGKIAPTISPNKTFSGSICGLLLAMSCSAIFVACIRLSNVINFSIKYGIIMGAIIGIISQIGDLSESLIKRGAGAQESGKIPGLGGILDMVDSLLFTTPVVYYVMLCLNKR